MTLPPRTLRATLAAFVALAVAVPAAVATGPPAAASGDSGASSRVVGRGEILTSILLGGSRARGARSSGVAPRCRWSTLSDADLEWLVEFSLLAVRLGGSAPLFDRLEPLLGEPLPDGDYQIRICGGEVVDGRFVERSSPRPENEQLLRQMITRLPVPEPSLSPPPGATVPVGQPVFVSLPPTQWRTIEATLVAGTRVAEVRAEPVAMRVISGDPATMPVTCSGPGRAFEPNGADSAHRQARHPDACTITYRTSNQPVRPGRATATWVLGDTERRPPAWIGAVTVVWSAQWRVDDGPWRSLGSIQRTRLIDRSVRELTTSIRSRR